MKVLFVGAGKRLEIAKKFISAYCKISSYEDDINCPLNNAPIKIIKGLKWADPKIKEDIQKLSSNFDVVIPFQDEATKILSELKFNNPNFCVSDIETTACCLDKKLFEQKFYNKDYYPKPLDGYQAISKPIKGFGSKGIELCNFFTPNIQIPNRIYQKRITGGHEYSVDCDFSKSNELVDFVPRKRIEVVGGEVVKSVTVHKSKFNFEELIKDISKELKFVGPVCIQFISDEFDKLWIMEVNARFGGGATLSIAAGFDMIDLIKKEYYDYQEIKNYYSNWMDGLHVSRCFVDYYHRGN